MSNIEIYKSFGILSFAAGWSAIIVLLAKWGSNKAKSISHHAAVHKPAYLMAAVLESISLLSLALFTVKWMSPTFGLPLVFSACCILLCAGLFLAAWVPTVPGIKGKIHDAAAYGASLLFIPVVLLLAVSPNVSRVARGIDYVVVLCLLAIVTLFLVGNIAKRNHLYFQCAYILIFDIGLLTAAYIR